MDARGEWRREPHPGPPDRTILVAGDWAPILRYERLVLDDPEAVYGDLLEHIRAADLRIVNLECPLSDAGAPIAKDGPNLRGDPRAIEALIRVPFHVACLANNHTFDYGPAALEDTRTLLRERGVLTVGAGPTREEAHAPLIVEVGEVTVGIVNFCEGEDGTSATTGPGVFGFEIDAVVELVRDLRRRVDVVIAIAHAGREYAPAPPPYVQAAYRAVARAGADAVVGHHPHVPQGIEVRDGVPIAYSLGNFVYDSRTRKAFPRLGYLLSLQLTESRVTGFRVIPYRLMKTGLWTLDGPIRAWFLKRLEAVSKILSDPTEVQALWEALLDFRGERYWRVRAGGLADLVRLVRKDPREGAAKLRNRVQTPAHAAFLGDGFARLAERRIGTAPDRARAVVEDWQRMKASALDSLR